MEDLEDGMVNRDRGGLGDVQHEEASNDRGGYQLVEMMTHERTAK